MKKHLFQLLAFVSLGFLGMNAWATAITINDAYCTDAAATPIENVTVDSETKTVTWTAQKLVAGDTVTIEEGYTLLLDFDGINDWSSSTWIKGTGTLRILRDVTVEKFGVNAFGNTAATAFNGILSVGAGATFDFNGTRGGKIRFISKIRAENGGVLKFSNWGGASPGDNEHLANTIFEIAGSGIDNSGALIFSNNNSAILHSTINLTGDATISVGTIDMSNNEFGSPIQCNGHTLTKIGTGTLKFSTTENSDNNGINIDTGKLVIAEGDIIGNVDTGSSGVVELVSATTSATFSGTGAVKFVVPTERVGQDYPVTIAAPTATVSFVDGDGNPLAGYLSDGRYFAGSVKIVSPVTFSDKTDSSIKVSGLFAEDEFTALEHKESNGTATTGNLFKTGTGAVVSGYAFTPNVNVGNGGTWTANFTMSESSGTVNVKGVRFYAKIMNGSGDVHRPDDKERGFTFTVQKNDEESTAKTSEALKWICSSNANDVAAEKSTEVIFGSALDFTGNATTRDKLKVSCQRYYTETDRGSFMALTKIELILESWSDNSDMILEVSGQAALEMKTAVNISSLTINGVTEGDDSLLFFGDNAITSATTTINADTDVSEITATLGAVTVAAGKTLTVSNQDAHGSITVVGTSETPATIVYKNPKPSTAITTTTNYKMVLEAPAGEDVDGVAGVEIDSQGGEIEIAGKYTGFTVKNSSTQTDIKFKDANVEMVMETKKLSLGNANVTIEGETTIKGYDLRTCDGAASRPTTINQKSGTITLSSQGAASGTSAAILLGHWPTATTTYNLAGGSLIAESGGLRLGHHSTSTMNIQGGTCRVKGIQGSGNPNEGTVTRIINLESGRLEIGSDGITSTENFTINLKGGVFSAWGGSGEISINNPLTISDNTTSTLSAETATTMTLKQAVSGSGNLIIGEAGKGGMVKLSNLAADYTGAITVAGGTLDISAFNPETTTATVKFDDNAAEGTSLKVRSVMLSGGGAPALKVPANGTLTILLTEDEAINGFNLPAGSTNAGTIVYKSANDEALSGETNENGGYTPAVNKWQGDASGGDWSDEANWSAGALPTEATPAVIELSQSMTIALPADAAAKSLIVRVAETATASEEPITLTFTNATGEDDTAVAGSLTVSTTSTLHANTDVSALTGTVNLGAVEVDTGTTLSLAGLPNSTEESPTAIGYSIVGAGRVVVTSGVVNFTSTANTYTGGLTIAPGATVLATVNCDQGKSLGDGGGIAVKGTIDARAYACFRYCGLVSVKNGAQFTTSTQNALWWANIQLEDSAVATVTAANCFGAESNRASTFRGNGTLSLKAAPQNGTVNFPATPTEESPAWTGTVELNAVKTVQEGNSLERLGNVGSKIKLIGVNSGFVDYRINGQNNTIIPCYSTIMLEKATDSFALTRGHGGFMYVFAGALMGEGSFTINEIKTESQKNYIIQFNNLAGFSGQFSVKDNKARIRIATESEDLPTTLPTDVPDGGILIAGTAKIAKEKTWTATGGIKVTGVLGGNGSVGCALTFADGATLDAREGAVTVSGDVTFPTGENEVLKVIVAEEPTVGTVLLKGAGLTAETVLPQVAFVNAAGESLDASSVALKVTDEGLVIAKKAVASWNNQSFETLQAAIDAAAQAEGEQTITLLVSPNAEDLTIPAGATINLTGEGVLNGLVVVEGSLKVDENITVTQGILTYKTLEETTCFASDLNAHMANDESIGGFKVRESLTITLDVPLTKSVRFKPTGTAATVALQSNLRPTQANLDLYVFEDGVEWTQSWSNKSPIALWEGDFADGDAKVGALTFNLNNESGSATGNRLEGGSLVIGDTQGAVFTGAENLLNEGTYFIQGADLMSNGIQYTHLMAVMANDESTGQVGLSMMSNGNPGWISTNAGNSFDLGTPQREIILTGDSLLIVTASRSNGLSLYRILPGARTTVEKVFEKSDLPFNAAKGFVLGGGKTAIEGNLASAEGWTIQKLAVFDYAMTEAEMQSYMFPSERETITAETFSASELNALITTKPDLAEVVFHQDVTLTLDDALNAETIKFMSNYAVGLTVSADAELPSDLTAYDFTLVQGDVTLAGGLKPEQFLTAAEVQTVVGVNFHASAGGDTSSALEAGTWFAAEDKEGRAKLFEGLSTLSWSAAAVATANANDTTFLNGSLNENVTVTLTNVPYETFDLIVYCSDTENCTVSDAGAVSTQSAPNAKRYNGITRTENYTLTISASCLAGFQILPAGTYTGLVLTVPANGTTWDTAANWTYNQVGGNSDPATVVVSGNSTVTVSENVTIDTLTVKGAGELTLQLADGVTFAAADLVCEEGASLKVVKAEGATTATLRITEALSDRMVVTIGDGVRLDIAETVNPQMKAVFDFKGTAIVNVYLANEGDYKVVQVPATATKVTENTNLTLKIFVAGTPVVPTEDWSIVTVENATVDGLASHYTTIAQYPVWMNYDGTGNLETASCWSTGAKPTAATSVILDVLDSGYLAGIINVSDTIYFRGIDGVTVSFESGSSVTTKNIVTLTPGMSLLQYIYIYSEEYSYAPIMPSKTFEMKHEDNELVIMTYNANYENEVTITGKGSVRIANSNFDKTGNGAVIMTKANTYTGGTIVESTMSLTSTVAGGYGAAGSTIVVEDGASVDVANTAGYDYNYQIVGKGIYYADYQYYTGALYHIPTAANDETIPYAKSIRLTGDAMIRVGVQAENGAPRTWGVTDTLDLHGHQLQKQAQGTFILKDTTGNFGEFRVMEGGLQVEAEGATLSDVTLSIEDKSTLTLNGPLAGLAKLRFKAGNEGITMTGIDKYQKGTSVVEVDASYVNVGVADFDTLYLKTDANESESAISRGYIELVKGGKDSVGKSEISNDFVDTYYVGSSRLANGRLKRDSTAIIADVEALEPFWHYAFNNGTGNTVADGALGADALYKAEMLHGTAPELAYSRHGKAGHVTSSTELYWDRVVSMNSAESAKEGEGAVSYENTPFSAGVITITTLVKPAEVGDRVLWAWGDGDKSTAIALVAQSDKTLSVEHVAYHGAAQEIMHVDVPNLTSRYHFVVLEIDPAGGRLGVWDPKARDYIRATSPVGLFSQVPASGRLGHIHGGWLGGLRAIASEAGCFIDDWQIYDTKLTPEELQAIRLKVAPDRAMIQIR